MTAARLAVNVPLLRKVLEHIEAHPEEWDQGKWSCGTAGCFAYHAAMIDGAQMAPPDLSSYVLAVPEDDPVWVCADGTIHVADRAQRVLGLPDQDDHHLFFSGNTLDDLRRIVAELSEDSAS